MRLGKSRPFPSFQFPALTIVKSELFFVGIPSPGEGERYSIGLNALKRSAFYKPFFLNYCYHMSRSPFLEITGSVQQKV